MPKKRPKQWRLPKAINETESNWMKPLLILIGSSMLKTIKDKVCLSCMSCKEISTLLVEGTVKLVYRIKKVSKIGKIIFLQWISGDRLFPDLVNKKRHNKNSNNVWRSTPSMCGPWKILYLWLKGRKREKRGCKKNFAKQNKKCFTVIRNRQKSKRSWKDFRTFITDSSNSSFRSKN